MAIAAEAVAPEVEGAGSGLSSGARSAVSSAAAGHGKRLTPEVAKELRKRATRKSSAKSAPARSGGGSGPSIVRPAARAAASVDRAGGSAISGGKGGTAARVIFAFGAGLLALELASYLSGRYFTWNIAKGAQKAQTAAVHLDLYPGQSAKLATQAASPTVGSGLPQYGGGTLV